jgi:hypothetical protein
MRLIRTIAKTKRKQRYYTQGLQEIFEICQLLSVHNPGVGVTYRDKKLAVSTVEQLTIKYADGIVNDIVEDTDITIKKVDAGIMSKKKAMMKLDNYTEKDAEKELVEINEDKAQFVSLFDQPGQTKDVKVQDKSKDKKNNFGGQ